MDRYLTSHVQNDLKLKMVLLGGPRQVGKTTMALHIKDSTCEPYVKKQTLKMFFVFNPIRW